MLGCALPYGLVAADEVGLGNGTDIVKLKIDRNPALIGCCDIGKLDSGHVDMQHR